MLMLLGGVRSVIRFGKFPRVADLPHQIVEDFFPRDADLPQQNRRGFLERHVERWRSHNRNEKRNPPMLSRLQLPLRSFPVRSSQRRARARALHLELLEARTLPSFVPTANLLSVGANPTALAVANFNNDPYPD